MLKLNIKEKLKEKNLNRNQFSKLMKITYPAACALYEGATSKISFDILENICLILECTPNDILISDNPKLQQWLRSDTPKAN